MATATQTAQLTTAALECFAVYGVRKTSLTDVADRAGVSRSTAYRAFGDKEGLVRAVTAAEMERFLGGLDRAVAWDAPLREALESAITYTVGFLRDHAALRRLLRQEPEELVDVVVSRGGEGSQLGLIHAFAVERLRRTRYEFRVTHEQAAEWLVRSALSLLLAPTTTFRSPAEVADAILCGIAR